MKEIKRKVTLQLDDGGFYWLVVPNGSICLNNLRGEIPRTVFLNWAKAGFKKRKLFSF